MTQLKLLMKSQKMNRRTARAVVTLVEQLIKLSKRRK